ncbi:DNA cytosine methyltransferase [Vreelandella neptunia]|uniref:DNA (cytosine-5-)-methyltransferase n=1 Tax=Vreelandella neptunia TaxID=115551 RepID=A0ABZ0YRE8_9GAMM|nr:DNA cytosine methyltransferase [Halomonas neptunia]MDN3561669.1 DNA cytosine methyltransferase [Halomonas neptunia]WQH14571.1 DNA cytosine methyltransferase [Halomonas neptunia]
MSNLNLFGHELVVDNFAGGGGASEGIEQALGRSVDLAINHDATAIAVHTANHPGSEHSVADVWDVDPEQATNGMPVGLAWFSPDCRHHSKAKGGRPVSKSVRGLAWVAARWAAKVKPRVIVLENVEEFQDWGPLIKGADGKIRPDPARKGQTFRGFVSCLKRHGYQVDWRLLRACDYGAPTIRKRLFLIARRDGLPITWPKPTHADPKTPAVQRGKLKPWRSAAECIDWSLPCPSIFDRKKPLATATLNRIAKGVKRYVIDHQQPFIVDLAHTASYYTPFRGQSLLQPLQTITTSPGYALVTPTLIQTGYGERPARWRCVPCGFTYDRGDLPTCGCLKCGAVEDPVLIPGQEPRALDLQRPLGTVVAGGQKHALVAAFLAKHYTGVVGADLRAPMPTVTTTDHNALVSAFMINMKGSQRSAIDARAPLNTICASTTHAYLTAAFLAPYYGSGSGETGRDLREPAPTVTTKDRFQLVTVMIDGEQYAIVDIGMRMLQPHELAMAQGFPASYQFAHIDGKPLAKHKQVRLIGNSVCPPLARAIVEANFTHEQRYMPLSEVA